MKKLPLEYWMVTKTYLPSFICDSSDGSDSSDSSDSSDNSDISDSSDQKTFTTKNFFHIKTIFSQFFFLHLKTFFHKKKSNCDETQTQILMKLKNSNWDESQELKL